MGWVPRIPEIKEAIGLTNSQLGLVFIGSTIGAVLGAQLAGRAIHTFGTKKVISVAVLVMPVGLIGMASAKTFTELFLALFVLGFGYANLDITSNTVAVEVENLVNRKWMVSFHGCWSTGAFATTVLGGSIAHVVAPRENLIGVALVAMVCFIPLSRFMLPPDLDNHKGDHEDSSAKIPLFAKKTAPLWWLWHARWNDCRRFS
jgi:MFS family permease